MPALEEETEAVNPCRARLPQRPGSQAAQSDGQRGSTGRAPVPSRGGRVRLREHSLQPRRKPGRLLADGRCGAGAAQLAAAAAAAAARRCGTSGAPGGPTLCLGPAKQDHPHKRRPPCVPASLGTLRSSPWFPSGSQSCPVVATEMPRAELCPIPACARLVGQRLVASEPGAVDPLGAGAALGSSGPSLLSLHLLSPSGSWR